MQKINVKNIIHYLNNHNEMMFEHIALQVFKYQLNKNPLYAQFCHALKLNAENVKTIKQIPFLPISFFKSHSIKTQSTSVNDGVIFESSGTTGFNTSKHLVAYPQIYQTALFNAFKYFFGHPSRYVFLGLLPSYLQQKHSSLIYMVKELMRYSNQKENGFYLDDFENLHITLRQLRNTDKKVILIGVTYALLDFVQNYKINYPRLIVMETGGMKGRRKELTRSEVHQLLKQGFHVSNIHSEYGMTELLSQAYSERDGIFHAPPWMKVLVRDTHAPLHILQTKKPGAINIIDIANTFSCPFIATDDLGQVYEDGSFEVLGRIDFSDVRGCNTMIY
jgi:hypothetical protein